MAQCEADGTVTALGKVGDVWQGVLDSNPAYSTIIVHNESNMPLATVAAQQLLLARTAEVAICRAVIERDCTSTAVKESIESDQNLGFRTLATRLRSLGIVSDEYIGGLGTDILKMDLSTALASEPHYRFSFP